MSASTGRRNILLIMADQWRWDTLFEPGHVCRTRHLDAFAEQAVVFDRAYPPCPLCCPTRGSMLTGRWPHQTRLMDNIGGGSYYPHGKLHPGRRTYLERLQDAGYSVSYCGKWHLGQGTLHARGIDNVLLSDGGRPDRGTNPRGFGHPPIVGESFDPYYASFDGDLTLDAARLRQGAEQVAALAEGARPFCSVISLSGPHFPHTVPKRFADVYADLPGDFMPANFSEPYSEAGKPSMQGAPYWPCQYTQKLTPEDWRRTCQHYWAFCTHLDEEIGRLLSTLEGGGVLEDTVIAFTADHGEMLGAHGMFDKGPYFYEEIMRIPMVVWDPEGRSPAAPHSFANLRDLLPTLISLAGAEDVLTGDERTRSFWSTEHAETYYTYDAYQGREFKLRGIHAGRYKYNWSPHDLCELYDLEADPGEQTNLIADPSLATVRSDLHGRLVRWMDSEGDYLLRAEHLLPPGAYIDGRPAAEQHDHGVTMPERRPS